MTKTLVTAANLLNYVQGSVTATDEAITLSRQFTAGGVAFQVTGTFSGTITFEATVDGATWVVFNVTPAASGTDVSTATAVGAWSKQNNGYAGFRARFSTATSGTPVITIRAVNQRN